ncbi:MAG: hypothetical protein ACRDRR_15085 [Pseudonocardiaceae bacterium]
MTDGLADGLAANDHGYTLAQTGQAVPVDRADRRPWGAPVELSTTLAVGTGYLTDFDTSTRLHIRQEATVDWSKKVYDPNALGAGQAPRTSSAALCAGAAKCGQGSTSAARRTSWRSAWPPPEPGVRASTSPCRRQNTS